MIGTRLADRYELTEEVGRGGMGVVYRGRDPRLSREVAVKMIPPLLLRPEAEERFRREAQVVARMDHPAIVPIYDFGQHDGSLFIVMPLVRGTTLRERLRAGGLHLGEILDIVAQVAGALSYSHALGVVHRDIKPENLMIGDERGQRRVRVMDFGLAHGAEESLLSEGRRLTRSDGLVGTVAYLSPEQVDDREVDRRSDVYALGAVFYECLAGEPPFTGSTHALLYRIAHEPPRSLRQRGVDVAAELDDLVLRCLAKDPGQRPSSCDDLDELLVDFGRSLADGERSKAMGSAPSRGLPQRSPLVGRQDEWRELRARLDAALAGECQLVLVGGEAGIGKSRLLEELEHLSRVRGLRTLRGRVAHLESALPYQGFCELIQDYFRSRERGSSSSGRPDLLDIAPELLAQFPVLAEVAELRAVAEGSPVAHEVGPTAAQPTTLYELLARTLARLARGRPLVLLIENLHTADVSIEALHYIVRRLGPTPTLIAATYRASEVQRGHPLRRLLDSFHNDPRFCSITLGPMSREEFGRWVEWLVGSTGVEDATVEELYAATEGNPFFGRELVRSLLETGDLRRDDRSGAWELAGEAALRREALPATIQQAVERRVENLPEAQRRVLAMASVLGRSFDYRDLQGLAGADVDDLDADVDALVARSLLEEDRKARGDRLSFSSGVMRDVLYHSLPRRKRRQLHRRHAEQLEARFEGRLERVHPRLVDHFSAAEVADKTVRYSLELARRSLEAFSPEDAMAAVRKGLEFAGEVAEQGEAACGATAEAELRILLSGAQRALGYLDRAVEQAARAAEIFEHEGSDGRAAAAALEAAECAWQGRRSDDTRRWAERGIELARRAAAVDSLQRLLTLGATVANLGGEHVTARAYLEEVESLAVRDGDSSGMDLPVGGTLTTTVPIAVDPLEPGLLKTDEQAEVALCVFETLLRADDEGHPTPWLCESWQDRDEGLTFVLTLRPGVQTSDGRELTAGDVKASLERSARVSGGSVAALRALEGHDAFLERRADTIAGIEAVRQDGREHVIFRLVEPLPIFPALLTDPDSSIARPLDGPGDGGGERPVLVGTGPFRRIEGGPDRVVLERHLGSWLDLGVRLDRLVFRTGVHASDVAAGLRAGEIDVGRDLQPEDLEEILRDPRFRSGLAEATKKNVYFVLFNTSGPLAAEPRLRQALSGVLRPHDLVWRTLGRFAQPASCLIPPGLLGHDPGRRQSQLTAEQAGELLGAAGIGAGTRLRAAVHPLLRDRYRSLTQALFDLWSGLGIAVDVVTTDMRSFLATYERQEDIDLLLGRWNADFDDPDNFTHSLFHSRLGILRRYFSSPEADRLLEKARRSARIHVRRALYSRFEDLLAGARCLLPLFHDIDYRIPSSRVRGLRLRHTRPMLDYAKIAKLRHAGSEERPRLAQGRELRVPIPIRLHSLDPISGSIVEYHEVQSTVFETLTGIDAGAHVVPRLAASFETEDSGRRYRFRLRPNVRFHDGRRLTVRDVRYTFERALQEAQGELHFPLLPVRGARALRDGRADTLTGLRLTSSNEIVLELREPLPFFPVLLSYSSLAIVPEGETRFDTSWRLGCVGTGPFRVVSFDEERIELERHPHYWRRGLPRHDRLTFALGLSSERILEEFRRGQLSVASDLRAPDFDELRKDSKLASGYLEAPRLSSYLLAFNARRGPLADAVTRHSLAQILDPALLLPEISGPTVIPAHSLIPPGLLGYEPSGNPGGERSVNREDSLGLLRGLHLRMTVQPVFLSQYAGFWQRLEETLRDSGIVLDVIRNTSVADMIEHNREGSVDLTAVRWVADFPDADTFATGLLQSRDGVLGRLCGSPEIDRLIREGRHETEPALRHSVYRRLEELVVREAFLVPLFHDQSYRFVQPSLRGLRLGLLPPEVHYEELRIEG